MAKRKHAHSARTHGNRTASRPARRGDGTYWIYGAHAVRAALANPLRQCRQLSLSDESLLATLPEMQGLRVDPLPRERIAQLLPPGAVHQGLALLVDPLPAVGLAESCIIDSQAPRPLVVLDQVTDPRNVGAILRSAAAFNAAAVILPARHSPPETGALAKAASGALEHVPLVRVNNLVRALEELAEIGFWRYGFAADATETADSVDLTGNVALVFGAEGSGLRQLTGRHCDHLIRLPITDTVPSLNVSTAAAVALYLTQRRP